MAEDPVSVAADLPGLADVSGVRELADRRVADGDAAFVADLGIELINRYGRAANPIWQYHSVIGHVVRALAAASVEQTLRLGTAAGPRTARMAASLLAANHSPADLVAAAASPSSAEVLACLVHELVLRGTQAADLPWTIPAGHPLGRLPGELTSLERATDRPAEFRAYPRTTASDAPAGTGAAVADWLEDSNAWAETRVHEPAAGPEAAADRLLRLDLECLQGAETVRVAACTPAQAWRELFLAASLGGAYSAGEFGAYGRLAAWRSVAGLTGAAADAGPAEVERRATATQWYAFDADTAWFAHVAWDLALAAITPGRVAVLAATDSD